MSTHDRATATDLALAGIHTHAHDNVGAYWRVDWKAELFTGRHWKNPDGTTNTPDFVAVAERNLLTYGGASVMWEQIRGAGSTATSAAKKYFNATAALGVGNSTVAAAATQTALQAASSRQLYKALTGGFPTHTTGSSTVSNAQIVYKSTFGLTEANFAWNEFALANKSTSTNRRIMNRKVQNLLTKTSAATATLTVTLTLA